MYDICRFIKKIKEMQAKSCEGSFRRGKMMAVCGFVHRKGRVLMCKRGSGMLFPGFWEFPTEVLEEGETAEDALERGFFERLTDIPVSLRPAGAVDFSCGGGGRLLAYDVELSRNFIHLYGYDDFRWVKLKDMRRLRVLEPHVTLLTAMNHGL